MRRLMVGALAMALGWQTVAQAQEAPPAAASSRPFNDQEIWEFRFNARPPRAPNSYTVAQGPEGAVISGEARGVFSFLSSNPLAIDLKEKPCLHFSWRVDQFPAEGDDPGPEPKQFAARVYAWTNSRVGGLNYVWARNLPVGTVFKSPFSTNRVLVIRSGPPTSEALIKEVRNVRADYEYAFGVSPTQLRSVWIMTNSNTPQEVSRARFTAIYAGECPDLIS